MAEEGYYYSDEDDGYDYKDGEEEASPAAPSPPRRAEAASGGGGGGGGGGGAAAAAAASASAAVHAAAMSKASAVASATSMADLVLLSPADIEREQRKAIDEVASVLSIPAECANTLLKHFAWNTERLFEAYTADTAKVQAAAGITHMGVASHPSAPFECGVCMNMRPAAEGFGLGCKHMFCRDCWSDHLSVAVSASGKDCIFTRCPHFGCPEAVTMSTVAAMAPRAVVDTWKRFELQQFVNLNKRMAWCPNPGCANAFLAKGPVKTAVCVCGTKFCFRCSREAHEPLSCDQVEAWLHKCTNDSETANWILANTKKCPMCSVRIEKNQGCNHMQCKSAGCRHEFCWVCLGPWAAHGQSTGGYYACNKYKSAPKVEGADKSKADLDRYLFYFQRYSNHDQAGRFAAKHREAAERRMRELQASGGLAYSDVTFLTDGTEALLECRRVLKYTYVYGFYLKDGAEKHLFEHLQEQLERSTEHLAELTEKPVDKMDRGEVINFTRVTMQFLRNLLTGIDDGLTA